MKYLLIAATTVAMSFSAYAGCGNKVASIGKVAKVDDKAKTLTIDITESSDKKQLADKKAVLKITPETKILPADADINGKKVTVMSEHNQIDYIIVMVADESKPS